MNREKIYAFACIWRTEINYLWLGAIRVDATGEGRGGLG